MNGSNTISRSLSTLSYGLCCLAAAIIIQAAIDGYIKRIVAQNGQPVKAEHKFKLGSFELEDKWESPEPAAT